jgi:hypothetical protein
MLAGSRVGSSQTAPLAHRLLWTIVNEDFLQRKAAPEGAASQGETNK